MIRYLWGLLLIGWFRAGGFHMEIKIQTLRKQDDKKAIRFAIVGMHFDWYFDAKALLRLYGRYFWSLAMNQATQALGAYVGDRCVGVLLANLHQEKKSYGSWRQTFWVKTFDLLQRLAAKDGVSAYEEANWELLQQYTKTVSPDGEILFLAADPELEGKGVGTALLAELARREKGKEVYLYTDNACNYQFYEHRGFCLAGAKEIVLDLPGKTVPLQCFLYHKTL